ncbi:MAG: 4-(cytidine 5'-diphospho)-2-C-methyl-D-erythritol kinase [Planctomycetes bacterium]|nr:4-(cytidine 5'-diphospho)-2-C-methyl-D-erythritol kinase [Planctomycetota bacterium]
MPPTDLVTLDSPAKVNLALSIGSPIPPRGYHPLASWMVAVHFADRLDVRRAQGNSRFELSFADDAPVRSVVDWPLEKDLAFRAHRLLEEHAGRPLPVHLTLRKRIPAGAGLGGGSGNAAATLVAVDRLFGLHAGEAALRGLGGKLGSDVAFLVGALLGSPSAIVTGLGETIEPAPTAELLHLVLIFPGFGCPTGEVYQAFDQLHPVNAARAPDVVRVRNLTTVSPVPQDGPFNDLAEPACRVRPELARIQRELTQALALPIHITGSGSTLFVIAPSATAAKPLARKVTAVSGLPAIATRSLG